ncbi:MAG: hypothetical protein ACETWM_22305 [Candidatus Lokiarchaeia archaeon]
MFRVSDAQQINGRAKEYLHRLNKLGEVQRVHWGWYYIPEKQDVWEFLGKDKNFKVLIKQTAASIWNYDFVHRNVYRLAVEDQSYKNALENFAKERGWIFEVEYHERIPYKYKKNDGLFIESIESCIVNCTSEWAFMDAFATLYFRRNEVDFHKIKQLGRWRRIVRTNTRVWTAIKYGLNLFNEQLGKRVFNVRAMDLEQNDIKELIVEAVERVMEFA